MAGLSGPRPPAAKPSTGLPRDVRPKASFPLQTKDGQVGVSISRPSPAPQWPLPESIIVPTPQVDGEPFRPPGGNTQPPQRPRRPSRVPSILDASKVQEHTPVFQYRPRPETESSGQELLAVAETPSSVSRPSTLSSVGSIPDFPLPAQVPPGPPRRSVNLGPPPSARRGASSFYSNSSFVSPIPEESPRSRSHDSIASSAAMPEHWGSLSPGPSPGFPDPIYGEAIAEEPGYGDDDAEESRLVRSASIGKRAKPTLVSAPPSRGADQPGPEQQRPGPQPVQGPFQDGTGYVENSSSSGTIPRAAKSPIDSAVTPDAMLNAYASASADDPSTPSPRATPSPNPAAEPQSYSRFSAIRRPPRLDIDAVRKAEARGSLTSLPDLIRRATRLAASLEKGRRPASRFDDLDDMPDRAYDREKHRSGLSDMLAAFPPPAQQPATTNSRRSIRDSIREQVQSWPLPLYVNRNPNTSQEAVPPSDSRSSMREGRRRCCGLPRWGFILLLIAILGLVAAAVVVPVEFLVVRKQDKASQTQKELQQCRQELVCANGGTNVVNQGVCSCDCVNGFTGPDCTTVDDAGCTTTRLTGSDGGNIVVGNAIPRLLNQAQTNFTIPLNATRVISKLESDDLSCAAQNALVTFDGRAARQDKALSAAQADGDGDGTGGSDAVDAAVIVDGVLYITITVVLAPLTTFTLSGSWPTTTTTTTITTTATSRRPSSSATSTSKYTTTMTMPSSGTALPPIPTPTLAVTEEVLDFARVAVLYVLQEDSLTDAETAQIGLQTFLGGNLDLEAARNVTLGGGRSVDLVGFTIDLGGGLGKVGGGSGGG
ncbi:uncharacterized protein P884DRAFT_168560, partial [Thermothelomyces heterothallicus CBS 202.75]|uniref:uncharacterized protein n=1 Tax=Thermothelomyces heterothallicus CBS 202.75 TaxID=1149848 RepID=UPI00374214FA